MKIFKNAKYVGMKVHPDAGFPCTHFEDENGDCWYDVRKNWTGNVIAVWEDDNNTVGSWSKNPLEYIPVEGQTLYEVDGSKIPEDNPLKLLGYYTYDGKSFEKKPTVQIARTKEDILNDLDQLKKELLSL